MRRAGELQSTREFIIKSYPKKEAAVLYRHIGIKAKTKKREICRYAGELLARSRSRTRAKRLERCKGAHPSPLTKEFLLQLALQLLRLSKGLRLGLHSRGAGGAAHARRLAHATGALAR